MIGPRRCVPVDEVGHEPGNVSSGRRLAALVVHDLERLSLVGEAKDGRGKAAATRPVEPGRAYDDGGRFLGVVQGAPEGRVRPVRLFVDVAAS